MLRFNAACFMIAQCEKRDARNRNDPESDDSHLVDRKLPQRMV
jgi:hypothetical protein